MARQHSALLATVPRDEISSECWILDSGSSNHFACNLKSLEDLEPQETPYNVTVASGHCFSTVGRGSVMTDRLKIPNVYYCPDLPVNIISIRQLSRDHGFITTIYHDRFYVIDRPSNIVGSGVYYNGCYVLDYLRIEQEGGQDDAQWEPHRTGQSRHLSSSDGESQPQFHISVGKTYANISAHPYNRSLFYMDSGAGCHVTPCKDLLQAYIEHDNPMFPDQFYGRQLVCADGKILAVKGMGNIDTVAIKLEDVLHVPGMVANLVSVKLLIDQLNEQLQGRGQAAVSFFGSYFIVHIFDGGMQNLLVGNGTGVGNDTYLLNVLQQL